MELYLVRHAWAEERSAARWPDDAQRPLTADGRRRFAAMCGKLAGHAMEPKLILTSPMLRCRQTAEILAGALPCRIKVQLCDDLLPGGDAQSLCAWLAAHCASEEAAACVGHAPDLDDLAAEFLGSSPGSMRFAKGSIGAIRFAAAPEFGQGRLRWFVSAKVLGV